MAIFRNYFCDIKHIDKMLYMNSYQSLYFTQRTLACSYSPGISCLDPTDWFFSVHQLSSRAQVIFTYLNL